MPLCWWVIVGNIGWEGGGGNWDRLRRSCWRNLACCCGDQVCPLRDERLLRLGVRLLRLGVLLLLLVVLLLEVLLEGHAVED